MAKLITTLTMVSVLAAAIAPMAYTYASLA